MTEAELLRFAGEYHRAYTQTDLVARIGFNVLADLRRSGAITNLGDALDTQLDYFEQSVQNEELALALMQQARTA